MIWNISRPNETADGFRPVSDFNMDHRSVADKVFYSSLTTSIEDICYQKCVIVIHSLGSSLDHRVSGIRYKLSRINISINNTTTFFVSFLSKIDLKNDNKFTHT